VIKILIVRGAAKVNMVSKHGPCPLSALASCQCALFDGEQCSPWYSEDFNHEPNCKRKKEMEDWIFQCDRLAVAS